MAKPVKVLIVDGSAPESELVLARLSAAGIAHEARRVEDKASFLAAIAEQCPDVILADFSAPSFDGHVALELAKRVCPNVPLLFLADGAAQKAQVLTILNADLEQFAYAASHDLQEPLRTISLFSKLLSTRYRSALDVQADEYLTFIESAAQHMGALLEDLSTYTQLPVQPKDFEHVDLNQVLDHTVGLFQSAIKESQGAVTSGNLPAVMGAGSHLGLVFQQLIGNALKYHGSDPPIVHVDAAQMEGQWVISVKDNGIGFPQQYAKQVFGLFKRLNKRDFPGTGLGLAICKRIVEVHGGRMWADSQENLGSTFYFTIPRTEQWQKSSSAVV
ncbi:MAG TPA: ATP-binding protein [Bryobacteraceae bacterium]|nr:ATP-binding protein [Bryobacteraceae bacterium]